MGFGVKRATVFAAFRAKRIGFAQVSGGKHLWDVSAPNGEMWTEYLPPELDRRAPQRLADLYGIPIEWFYEPRLIPTEESHTENSKGPSG